MANVVKVVLIIIIIIIIIMTCDRLCGLVVRVLGYREVVGLERGPLSLVSTTEGLLDRKVAAPV
jgi:hypothetical protein